MSTSGESGQFLSVAIPRPVDKLFAYRLPVKLQSLVQPGSWVKVPFGKKTTHGFVLDHPQSLSELDGFDPELLKDVLEVGGKDVVVPREIIALCRWASTYYQSPLGELINCAVPASALGLRSKKPPREIEVKRFPSTSVEFTEEQSVAFNQILSQFRSDSSGVHLLNGVTGSGKTEIYIALAREALENGQGVIFLVPEIGLTPQLRAKIESGLGQKIALWHSAMPDGERRDQWNAMRSGKLKVVVGARSAVFSPIENLGLIVVDEEHDPSYKQEERARYHGRDLAIVRGSQQKAFVLMGSATPSLEMLERVREQKFSTSFLTKRVSEKPLPKINIIDLRKEEQCADLQAPFAASTLEQIQETLRRGEQVILFLNKRGFASVLHCRDCGESVACTNCSISLTYHQKINQLKCHLCGHSQRKPKSCLVCQSQDLVALGAGTESLEIEIPKLIPEMKPLRLDRDMVTSNSRLESIIADFRSGKANTLMGTQMLVKGHDFPNVTLVVVVLADGLFKWPDFRARERAFQVLTQVAGRSGRGEVPGEVIVQTYSPDHPVFEVLQNQKTFSDFLAEEREVREVLGYPPLGKLGRIRIENPDKRVAAQRAETLRQVFDSLKLGHGVSLLGPAEGILERVRGAFRYEILVKARRIDLLQSAILSMRRFATDRKWPLHVDIDPYAF